MPPMFPDEPDDTQSAAQTWYAITISWGGSPQHELIVTRDAKLTIRRTVDTWAGWQTPPARTGSGRIRPRDVARADMADVDDWFEQFQSHSSRPVLEWHRIPAPHGEDGSGEDGPDLPGVIALPDETA